MKQQGLKKVLKSLIFTIINKLKILQLFYQYRHLNRENFINLSYINLIIYRIRIVFDIKSISIKT